MQYIMPVIGLDISYTEISNKVTRTRQANPFGFCVQDKLLSIQCKIEGDKE